jgi:hypothetical protein
MNKLTEIKANYEKFKDEIVERRLPITALTKMLLDDMGHLLSLLEEKDKALTFYADKKNYVEGYKRKFNDGTVIEVTPYVHADEGLIARNALLTSSNNEGETI